MRRATALVLAGLVTMACARVGAGPRAGAEASRTADVYTAVIERLATTDSSFGADHRFGTVWVLEWTKADTVIGADDQAEIERRLAGLHVEFLGERSTVVETSDQCDHVRDGGALMTLGAIPEGDDRVEVRAELFVACLAAVFLTYAVENGDEGWRVTGTVGGIGIA
jgi:hypothetical protein